MDHSTTIIPTAVPCWPETTNTKIKEPIMSWDAVIELMIAVNSDIEVVIQTLCQGVEQKRKIIGT